MSTFASRTILAPLAERANNRFSEGTPGNSPHQLGTRSKSAITKKRVTKVGDTIEEQRVA